jgi:hypothetical protein
VYTSAPIPIKVVPNCGFIPATFQQVVKVVWEASLRPNVEKLENSMFFVKALPLSPEMNIDLMNQHLAKVFNTYNVNILFTTHHLPSKVQVAAFNPGQMQAMQQRQAQLMQNNKV